MELFLSLPLKVPKISLPMHWKYMWWVSDQNHTWLNDAIVTQRENTKNTKNTKWKGKGKGNFIFCTKNLMKERLMSS